MILQQNLLEKAYFIAKMSGPAGQFGLLESALSCLDQSFQFTFQLTNLDDSEIAQYTEVTSTV